MTQNNLSIRPADPTSEEAIGLFVDLDSYLRNLYPREANHIAPPNELASEAYYFVIAYWLGEPCGCGAFRRDAEGYAEIKRIYVKESLRGHGLSRRIMSHLETKAREEGFILAKLETGTKQMEAVGLYKALGYRFCGKFADYPPGPYTLFMEKELLSPPVA